MTDFDNHMVRNKRTGRISSVTEFELHRLVSTGDYQPVYVKIKHGPAVPPLSELFPGPDYFILEVPGNDLISVPPNGDYYFRDQHLPTSDYVR